MAYHAVHFTLKSLSSNPYRKSFYPSYKVLMELSGIVCKTPVLWPAAAGFANAGHPQPPHLSVEAGGLGLRVESLGFAGFRLQGLVIWGFSSSFGFRVWVCGFRLLVLSRGSGDVGPGFGVFSVQTGLSGLKFLASGVEGRGCSSSRR